MRGVRTLQPDQSVIADTLALKASSWFRQTLRVGSQQVVLFQCQACGTFDCQLTWAMGQSSSLVPHDKKGFEHAPVKR